MKTAVLTWFNRGDNPGQVLQAYALQEAMKKQLSDRCDIVVLDYQYIYRRITLNRFVFPISQLYRAIRHSGIKKWYLFEKFRNNYINKSPLLFNERDIEEYIIDKSIKCIVLGSDQIWNYDLGPVPDGMMLDLNDDCILRIAYSPSSCCSTEYEKYSQELNILADKIKKFDFIGVRDKKLGVFLQDHLKKEVHFMLDPVFLLNQEDYSELVKINKTHVKLYCERYIFLYFVGDVINKHVLEALDWAKSKYDCQHIVCIALSSLIEIPKEWSRIRNYDPVDVLRLVENASFVFCDSFHMCAFSIIFRKQFYTVAPKKKDLDPNPERIVDLLEVFRLEDRLLFEDNKSFAEINYVKDIEDIICIKKNDNFNKFLNMCELIQ